MREDYEIELQPLLTAPLPKLPLAPVLRGPCLNPSFLKNKTNHFSSLAGH